MKKYVLITLLFTATAFGADKDKDKDTGKAAVLNILNGTKIEKIGPMRGWDLEEFVEIMNEKVPANFVIHQNVYEFETKRVPNPWPARIRTLDPKGDPANGLPPLPQTIPAPWAHIKLLEIPTDFSLPMIRTLQWPLKNLTAKQVLDAAMMSFDKPIKYIVEDYGVLIIKNPRPGVVTRRMKVNIPAYRVGGFFGGGLGKGPQFNK